MNKPNINIFNYEAWLLDLSEGSLSAEEIAALQKFMQAHPELDDELINPEFRLIAPDVRTGKNELKRAFCETTNITEDNYTDWMISSIENLLNSDEKDEFSTFLSLNSWAEKERALFTNTLLPDVPVVFPDKNNLKRSVFKPVYYWLSVVAAAILLLVVFNPFNRLEPPTKSRHIARYDMQKPSEKQFSDSRKSVPETVTTLPKPQKLIALNPVKSTPEVSPEKQQEEPLTTLLAKRAEQVFTSTENAPKVWEVAENNRPPIVVNRPPVHPSGKINFFDKIALLFRLKMNDSKEKVKNQYDATEGQMATAIRQNISIQKKRDKSGNGYGWAIRVGNLEYNSQKNSR